MLRIRTGARDGLRWGLFGFVAAVLTLLNGPIHAAPYADIVVDANSGAVLHATNPDARRHPASLTKIMTLYLLFEQLEAGKLKLDSALKVSAEASGQTPTKLGLKPGTTLNVEDAIKGMVTRSANDAAVVVAEAIAGSESEFAKVMTRKAQALGMKSTVYKNASGLPDDNQVTTARDQSILGRAVQERFPRYYKYFSIRSFTFRGQAITNHNHLLGKVDGVDGIKTGYINASGFNLVTSVHRGNRYLVAVVMGGSSGASRDARMRELINEKIVQASTKRTAPMVAEATPSEPIVAAKAEPKPEPMVVAKAEPKPEPMVVAKAESKPEPMAVAKAEPKPESKVAEKIEAKAEPKAEAKAEHRYAVASAISMPARLNPAAAPTERSEPPAAATLTQARMVVGSTDPIQPVLVKTLTVRAATKTPSLVPLQVASSAAESQPAPAPAPAAVASAKAEAAAAPPPTPAAVAKPETPVPPPVAAKPEPPAPAVIAKSEPASPAPTAAPNAEAAPSSAAAAAKPESPKPASVVKPDPAPAAAQKASAPAIAANPDPAPAALPAVARPPSSPVAIPAPRPAAAPAMLPAPAAKTAAAAAKPQHRPGWMIQVGAYPAEQAAKERLSAVQSKASKILTGAEAFTETVDKGGTTLYRARFAGLDKDTAEAACKYLKKNDVECVPIKN
jgi:D-alanyl-D-alanine carboxypeptidase